MDIKSILESLQAAQSILEAVESNDAWQKISTSDDAYPDLVNNFNDTSHYLSETISNLQDQARSEDAEPEQ